LTSAAWACPDRGAAHAKYGPRSVLPHEGWIAGLLSFLYSLIPLFLFSLISNATPFFGASYTLIATTELIQNGVTLDNFGLVVLVTAMGASIGKVFIYAGAKGFQQTLQKNRNVRLLGTWLGKTGFYLALFITALIPALPLDDYVYIGAGANDARLPPMLGVTFLAKLAKSSFEILLELSGIFVITPHGKLFGLSRLDFSILLSVALIVVGVVIYKVDWEPAIAWARRTFVHQVGPPPA
jgi:membrane protein DedA with SNARE-associated domain